MSHFIDRRLNPKDKSLGNRQRFLRRAREELRQVFNKRLNVLFSLVTLINMFSYILCKKAKCYRKKYH